MRVIKKTIKMLKKSYMNSLAVVWRWKFDVESFIFEESCSFPGENWILPRWRMAANVRNIASWTKYDIHIHFSEGKNANYTLKYYMQWFSVGISFPSNIWVCLHPVRNLIVSANSDNIHCPFGLPVLIFTICPFQFICHALIQVMETAWVPNLV